MPDPVKIGFLGMGNMGAPMAGNLSAAGYQVSAWNRSSGKADLAVSQGATEVDTPEHAAKGADILVVMLSNGPVCDDVLFGGDTPLAELMQADGLVIVMSSIEVDKAQTQAERIIETGRGYLDAPVSGGQAGAQAGTLAIMVGGAAHDFDRAMPVFEAMGRATHIGPSGSGSLCKLANQMIVAGTISLVSEAFILAERGGADIGAVRKALMGGFADSTILQQHGARMVAADWKPGGIAAYQLKDLNAANKVRNSHDLNLPVLDQVRDLFQSMCDAGHAELDHCALLHHIRGQQPEVGKPE